MLGPIFGREWLILPRRSRHYVTRSVYLAALWILLITFWQTLIGWDRIATLGDQARFALLAFQILSNFQLLLLLFFASLSAASTVAQEKDRRTFVLLLLTDLRNDEIVLGKLLGSILQIGLFLTGSIPIFMILMISGGIDPGQILEVTLILAMTGLAAGSLGSLVALGREKTFQALALTVLLLVLYFCLIHALGFFRDWFPTEIDLLQVWFEPFLALQQIISPPEGHTGLDTTIGFSLGMLMLTTILNGIGVWKLRVWNPSGEPIIQPDKVEVDPEAETQDSQGRASIHAAPGKARAVWPNPILWREISTRAYGRRPLLVKTAYFLVIGLILYYALFQMTSRDWYAAYGLVPIAILSLLLISAQAVTSITSERDVGALDLLMVTDLTPHEFIFGKLLGIVYNTKEYLIPPLILAGYYAYQGKLARPPRMHPELLMGWNLESLFFLEIALVLLMAFTIVFGLHVALRILNSRLAIINTLGTIFFLSVGTILCICLILINGRFEYQWLSFSGFIFAGVGGLWWVLNGDRPSSALTLASWICPVAVFYTITNLLIGKPGSLESSDPMMPFLVTGSAFGFTLAAMLVPLLSEFDIAIGRTSAVGE